MIQLEHSIYLYGLVLLIPFTLFFLWYLWWRRKNMAKFAELGLLPVVAPRRSLLRHVVKFVLLIIALPLLIITLCNPQAGSKIEKVKREGVDIVIAMDVSKSMMAEDVKPNRLVREKMFVSKFFDELSDDRIALIVFAGKAYQQMPMTVDYSAGKMYLENVNTESVPTQGTSIAEAVNMARKSFNVKDKKHKVLILITDGEDHEGADIEAIKEAVKEGVVVHTVGIGTEEGAPIPEYHDGVRGELKKDENGSIILTKLNKALLTELAEAGHGKAYILNSGNEPVKAILSDIDKMEKKGFEERIYSDYESQFQIFLALAMLFFIAEFFINERAFLRVALKKINI
jgi:Ca-activated chloride channel homolog